MFKVGTSALLSLLPFAVTAGTAEDSVRPWYANNREPLLPTRYVRLPLGTVTPRGWLRDQLKVQANGLTGHLAEVWPYAATSAWKGDRGMNIVNEPSASRSALMVPRWLGGLVPLAYLLDDPRLKSVVEPYMSTILGANDLAGICPNLIGWETVGRFLPEYYEATGDDRAVRLCRKILDYADRVKDSRDKVVVDPVRIGLLLTFSWWYYNHSGDQEVPGLVDRITGACVRQHNDYYRNFTAEDKTAAPGYPVKAGDHGHQGYEITQAMQYPVLFYLNSRDPSYRTGIFSAMTNLDKYDGQVGGRWNADEHLAGLEPTQGTELCDITELTSSLEKIFEAVGGVEVADRLEKLVFNALPGTCTPDFWAHQYDQQANQVLVSVARRPWHRNRDDSNLYGFEPNYWCCLSNMHAVFPRYVEHMWMATGDRGLVAVGYGPCRVAAELGQGQHLIITEETKYPFSDHIRFSIDASGAAPFPLYFRIPEWADKAELQISGERSPRKPARGTMARLLREWAPGDTVDLDFHNSVRTETRLNRSVSVTWGPLDFVLRVGESFEEIRTRFPLRKLGLVNWAIRPTTPWNYALVIDRDQPNCTLFLGQPNPYPFAQAGEPLWDSASGRYRPGSRDAPVIIKMKARRVPQWEMIGANAGPVPPSPVQVTTEEETVELIPYGCSRLRIAEFPTTRGLIIEPGRPPAAR